MYFDMLTKYLTLFEFTFKVNFKYGKFQLHYKCVIIQVNK